MPHADRSVHEALQVDRRGGANGANLLQREAPLQNHPRETALLQKAHPLGGHVAGLGRCVEFGREIHLPQGHVLHDEGIGPGRHRLPSLPLGLGQFVIVKQRVDRHVNPCAETVGILRRPANIIDRISGRDAGTETGTAHVDGIRPGVDSRHSRLVVPRGSQQFDGLHADKDTKKIREQCNGRSNNVKVL